MKTHYVGKLAGQLNISIAKSSSLSMRDFVQNILKLGIRIGLTDLSLDLSSGFIQLSQSKLNNSMKKLQKKMKIIYNMYFLKILNMLNF